MQYDSMHQVMLAGVTAMTTLVIGCGSGPITDDDTDDEIGDASESSDSDESEVGETDESDVGETEAETETDTGETETGDGDGDVCVTAEGTLGLAALRLDPSEDRAWVMDGDDELELELTGPAGVSWLLGAAGADRIAVGRITGDFGVDQQTTIHAFDRSSGELEWTRELDIGTSMLWVADDGWITGRTNWGEPGQAAGFAMNDDETIALADHRPMAAASEGWLAAHELANDGTLTAAGWISLADESWTPAEPPATHVGSGSVWIADDDRTLEYVAAGSLGPEFIRATPGDSEVFDLPNDQLPSESVQLVGSAGRFRLLQAFDPEDQSSIFVRIDIESDEVIVVDPAPPTDWTWFDCYSRDARITPEGAVLFKLHDGASARLWAFEPEGALWSEIGQAVGMVDNMELVGEFGAVHVVRGIAQFSTFCPQMQWGEPPAEALLGDSVQIVRHTPALAITLPLSFSWWQLQIDREESCVAYLHEEGWRVRGLEDETEFEFGPAEGTWLWLD